MTNLEEFIKAYIEAMIFTESGEDDSPLEGATGDESEFDPKTLADIKKDCREFVERHSNDIETSCLTKERPYAQAGHDFWMNRNGHGVGFWEKEDWEAEAGERLNQASEEYGEVDYIFDEGVIY